MNSKRNLTPEVLVPRLGDYLVEKGIITSKALEHALEIQKSRRTPDQPMPLIGNILIEIGAVERKQVDEAITVQILKLRTALEKYNQELEQRVKERTIELQHALEKLSELSDLKSNFVANISHELRTPLTHVKGYLDLLSSRDLGPISPDQEQAIFIMQRASDRLEHLIEDLILFSNAENEQISLKIQAFDLSPLLEEINKKVQKIAFKNRITVKMVCPKNLPKVKADPSKISWVITQLIDNAIKFNRPGGEVQLKATTDGNFVKITIFDDGIGIPEDKLEEIFEPFHQLDGSSTRKAGGTGLGLSLAKKIIEAHGSLLHVASKENKGTKFQFSLIATNYAPTKQKLTL